MPHRKLFYIFFFFSGFSALIYEIVWARQLGLVFGNTVYGISAILTIFFSGLALGSWLIGRLADHANEKRMKIVRMDANLLVIYALLELGIGIYATMTPLIFMLVENLQVSLSQQFNPTYSGFSFLTFGLAFASLIFPTILMGGTLPVMAKFLAQSQEKSGKVMGNLYGLNTLGGVLGVFLAGFFLIRYLGVRETIYLAAFINVAVGGLVFYLSRTNANDKRMIANERIDKQTISSFAPIRSKFVNISILIVFTITGFAALALEVLWTRVLILVFGSSTYAFTIILAVFLLGIALGSFLSSRFLVDRRNLLVWFVSGLTILGILVIFTTLLLPQAPFIFLDLLKKNYSFTNNLTASLMISFLTILPSTTMMGMLFPLGLKILVPDFGRLGQDLGRVYGLNTLGGILGSFAAGFILIPYVGSQKGIMLAGLLYLLSGFLVLFFSSVRFRIKAAALLVVLFGLVGIFLFPSWDKNILSSGVFVYFRDYFETPDPSRVMKKDQLLFYKEGLTASIAVRKDKDNLYLRINGKTDASTGTDLPTEVLAGHLPLLLHPNPQKVLVIGLGSGVSLGSIEQHPLSEIEMVEIEPAILEAARYFDKENHRALEDKRLTTIVGDGRNYLFTSKKKFDVISSEPSNLWVKGNADLFTREYFQLAKDRLEEDGIFLHWVQNYSLDKESLKVALATFRSVFPQMSVWSPVFSNDLLLVGTKEPLNIEFRHLEDKFQDQKIKQDLDSIGIRDAAGILGLFLFDGEGVGQLAGEGRRLHTDNRPVLEFSAPFGLGVETVGANLEMLLSIAGKPYSLVNDLEQGERQRIEDSLNAKENMLRGKIVLETLNFDRVLSYYLKALELDPGREQIKRAIAEVYFYQSESFYARRNWQGAKTALQELIKFNPSHLEAHINLGAVYFQEGNLGEAAQEWAIAKELDPENEDVNNNLQLLDKYLRAE